MSGEETEKGKNNSQTQVIVISVGVFNSFLKIFTVSILTVTVVVCVLACGTVLLSLGIYCHLREKSRQKTSTGKQLLNHSVCEWE